MERARMILALLDGETQVTVARRMGLRPNTVNKWRGLFISYGLAGLEDTRLRGRPKSVGKDLRERAIKLLETPPPKGQAAWDGKTLAAALDANKSSV
ncbi:MAG: helix-turn-helix domain-containing protein [Nostoc sp.]|uniref:helix-turn-helix domain-containing protein n=1 Tax=Nostoc sp. TaxID=1180 RepID=UPI002FFB39B3